MKKILVIVLLACLFCVGCYFDHNYTRKDCRVIQINDGIVRFEDVCGRWWDWEIEPDEYFEIGEFVDLKMNDNNTENFIEDDEITEIVFHD